MKRAGRIIRIVGMWGVLAATAGALRSDAAPAVQVPPAGELPTGRHEADGCLTRSAETRMQTLRFGTTDNSPSADLEWFRDEVDPLQRERRELERMMRQRAREQAVEITQAAQRGDSPRDPRIEAAGWRLSVGNNGNWSPYSDRELDARVIRYPMRDIRELDRERQKAGPPKPARPPK